MFEVKGQWLIQKVLLQGTKEINFLPWVTDLPSRQINDFLWKRNRKKLSQWWFGNRRRWDVSDGEKKTPGSVVGRRWGESTGQPWEREQPHHDCQLCRRLLFSFITLQGLQHHSKVPCGPGFFSGRFLCRLIEALSSEALVEFLAQIILATSNFPPKIIENGAKKPTVFIGYGDLG